MNFQVWPQPAPWNAFTYSLIDANTPAVDEGYNLEWMVTNRQTNENVGIRIMQSDLILTVPNPIDQYYYYFGVMFRPKEVTLENPDISSWDGWLIKF
jgi:hypothetical protein